MVSGGGRLAGGGGGHTVRVDHGEDVKVIFIHICPDLCVASVVAQEVPGEVLRGHGRDPRTRVRAPCRGR